MFLKYKTQTLWLLFVLCAFTVLVSMLSIKDKVPEVGALQSSPSVDIASFEVLLNIHAQALNDPLLSDATAVESLEQANEIQERAYVAKRTLEQLHSLQQQSDGVWEIREEDHPDLYRVYRMLNGA